MQLESEQKAMINLFLSVSVGDPCHLQVDGNHEELATVQ
jgi:hypothetical protein